MASYNELNALIDAYINRNGVQAITGQILNGVLKAMVEQLGRGYTIMGAATPTTDPGTPDGPECYFASTPGTYTDFDGLQVAPGELALLCYTPTDGWTKETIYEGFRQVGATIDGNVGTPSVGVSYADGVLSFDFHNMKGNPGQNGQDGAAAGFGAIGADITGGVGTPGVTVESSGPATAKNLQFHFTNLKGETGVTSVVATVDNTTGTPACTVSLVGQQLTLAFSGLKGAQGDTGSSVDYPFTIVNNLTTDDATQALSAAQGVVLEGEITQLEAEVDDLFKDTSSDYAIADENGNNLVEFADGHIKTKYFDSRDVPTDDDIIQIESEEDGDLSFSDDDENVLMLLSNGHIKTKKFDSSKLPILAIKKAVFMGDSITQGVYSFWHNDTHTDENRYNGFDIQNMTSIEEETAYHGIHYFFGLLSGANVVNLGRRGSGWVADTRNIGNALEMATDYDFADVDFVALCFGVNDYIQGKTIGDILTQSANTIIGNMCATIEKILTDNPLCKVVVYSPYNTWGQVSYGGDYTSNVLYGDEASNYALGHTINGNTLQDIIDAMQAVCDFYGIQCVDLSRSNVVNRFTIKNIMVDGLHPTKESYVKLASEIYGKGNFGA